MKVRWILASASPRRREILEQIGIEPEVRQSHLEEKADSADPAEVVRQLSLQKAADIAAQPDLQTCGAPMIVLGADTVVAAGGKILGKPRDHGEAADMIRLLQGSTHRVLTGVTMIFLRPGKPAETVAFTEQTEVDVAPMSEAEITAYADSPEPMDKAGAYAIQGGFAAYVMRIRGSYSNVVGLPAAQVYETARKFSW
jgi:septum formation protein